MTGSDFSALGDGMMVMFKIICVILCIFVPLGIWKLIDIIIWCCHHVHLHIQ